MGPALPEGVIEGTVNAGVDPRSEVQIYFNGPFTPTVETAWRCKPWRACSTLWCVRICVRSAAASTAPAFLRLQNLRPRVVWDTHHLYRRADPRRRADGGFAEIKDLRENGPSEAILPERDAPARPGRKFAGQQRLADLDQSLCCGRGRSLADIERIDELIGTITPEDIQTMAAAVLPEDRHVTLVLHPKDFQQ